MLPLRYIELSLFLLITWKLATAKAQRDRCPIGFKIAYTKYDRDDPICYRRKGPEPFNDKFIKCAGNLYTVELYNKLNITETSTTLWTDYKSQYGVGPFIDWSHTSSTGKLFSPSNKVTIDSGFFEEDELCMVIDPVSNFTAAKCDELHYRYCFIRPYVTEDDMSDDECKGDDFRKFSSPTPSCLRAARGARGGGIRANWKQAKELCVKRGAALLNRGWRYSNHPMFNTGERENLTFPLDIIMNPDNSSVRFDTSTDDSMIPSTEWQFLTTNVTSDMSYGALNNQFWHLVNSSHRFYDVICERPIGMKSIAMQVSVDKDDKIILSVNDTIDEDYIFCATDSETYYPKKVKTRYDDDSNVFVLKPIGDGYYWCTHKDTKHFHVSESNKALYIREKQSLRNNYAVKLRWKAELFEKLEDNMKYWEEQLSMYIYLNNLYKKTFGSHPTSSDELIPFKTSDRLRVKLIHSINLKRYLGPKSVLLHIQLYPEWQPVMSGTWDNLEVLSMKPVYYCNDSDTELMIPLGSSMPKDCILYSCVGDFNQGVQWVTSAMENCTTTAALSTSIALKSEIDLPTPTVIVPNLDKATDDSELWSNMGSMEIQPKYSRPTPSEPTTELTTEMTTEVTEETVSVTTSWRPPRPTWRPTTPQPTTPPPTTPQPTTSVPLPPDEQLQQVIDDLEALLQNYTVPITVNAIEQTFTQIDELLEVQEDIEIPGNLLHQLDRLGAKIDLNGSHQASAIRPNIALLIADAEPDIPVRGLRIASRYNDQFTEDAFDIISDEVNSTHLMANASEAVVHLPLSVATSSRRISFVVFRNDRAFPSEHGHYSVNSRVLSINVENLTEFRSGEVIDIHLSPLSEDLGRNASRSCAYWHFNSDGSGFWSQEGCTFIKSNADGILDTCRCDHLTHFAEVLVPRAVFSERNENVLEVLTIIGCCLSVFGLSMVGLTAALFRSWRRDFSNKVWLQLCIAIFILVLCFLIVIFAQFDSYNIPCMLLGVALHYSVLASFCWMLVAAVLSYRRLVIVFARDASHKLLRASAFAWGAPCAVVGILLSVDPHSYAGRFEEKTPSGAFCYPSGLGLWLAVYAPIAITLLANWTLFALIVRSVFASRRIQRHGDTNEAVRCASVSCLLVFLFGLPWLFGLFAYNVVAAYMFTLTATYQGFVLFLFFVLGNKKTRDLWLNKLKIKQTRKVPVTSSTYTHRSTAIRADPEGASSMERNSSKPRSLASPDNSRFS